MASVEANGQYNTTRLPQPEYERPLAWAESIGLFEESAAPVANSQFLADARQASYVAPVRNSFDSIFTGSEGFTTSRTCPSDEPYSWQILPPGLIYHAYLAGVKESRMASQWVYETREKRWLWDIALGGRAAVLRYGTTDPLQPEGWEIDIEGAGLPRLDPEEDRDLVSCDYRFGIPLTYGRGANQYKLAYYHLSSHLGDEFMLKNPDVTRINYSRDVIVFGYSHYCSEDLRLYGEAGWAFYTSGGSEPWEFQVGVEYSPAVPTTGFWPKPFFAVNGQFREELDYGGNLVVQWGVQWRGPTGHLFRMGLQYFTGKSEQFEFYTQTENKIGFGIWYDF